MGFRTVVFRGDMKRSEEIAARQGMDLTRSHHKDGFRRNPVAGSKYVVRKNEQIIVHGDWRKVAQFMVDLESI